MTFLDIIGEIRKKAFTERDKVFRFEKLVLTDPINSSANQVLLHLDLLKRIVMLSLETMKIVKALPKLGL